MVERQQREYEALLHRRTMVPQYMQIVHRRSWEQAPGPWPTLRRAWASCVPGSGTQRSTEIIRLTFPINNGQHFFTTPLYELCRLSPERARHLGEPRDAGHLHISCHRREYRVPCRYWQKYALETMAVGVVTRSCLGCLLLAVATQGFVAPFSVQARARAAPARQRRAARSLSMIVPQPE